MKEGLIEKFLQKTKDKKANILFRFSKDGNNRYYKEIIKELDRLKDYKDEIEKLKGKHTHYIIKEVEENILNLIDYAPEVLRIQNPDTNKNLGMICAEFGMKSIIEKCLKDDVASTQLDNHGKNLGYYCADLGYEDLVIKAMQNEEAIKQYADVDYNDNMITMSARRGLTKVLDIVIEDDELSSMNDKDGSNVPMICATRENDRKMDKYLLKAFDNPNLCNKKDFNGESLIIYATYFKHEDVCLKAISNNKNLMYDKASYSNRARSVGMLAVMMDLKNLSLEIAKDERACLQQDHEGSTIGMFACVKGMEDVVIETMKHTKSLTLQDFLGLNVGMYAARAGLEDATMIALDNHQASIQQSSARIGYGKNNIGMYAAASGLKRATLKALDNYEASIQQNEMGLNIGMYSAYSGMLEPTLKALENKVASKQRVKLKSIVYNDINNPNLNVGYATHLGDRRPKNIVEMARLKIKNFDTLYIPKEDEPQVPQEALEQFLKNEYKSYDSNFDLKNNSENIENTDENIENNLKYFSPMDKYLENIMTLNETDDVLDENVM